MKKLFFPILAILLILYSFSCTQKKNTSEQVEEIKAYNLDFNWGDGGPSPP